MSYNNSHSNLRHRNSPSEEYRAQFPSAQQQHTNSRSPFAPRPSPQPLHQQQSYGGGGYGGHHDGGYGTDGYEEKGYYDEGPFYDTASVNSHTALNMPPPHAPYAAQHHQYPPASPIAPPNPNSPFFNPQNSSPRFPAPHQQSEYSMARQKLLNRRSVRQVELTDGHLVLEMPVPRSILQYNSYKGEDMSLESGKMRYTAVTEDPDDFTRMKYRLRPVLYGRQTELFICLTMYNEDENLFCRTFTSVIKNIQHLQSRTKSKTWGHGSWKKVVVCVVSDGRKKINPRTLKVLGLYGAFQDGIAKDTVDGKEVQAHLFEYTTQVVVDAQGTVSGGISPVQILFCLKEENKKKLNSHRWAFNAFCPQLRPNVCVLLDVGTRPSGTSIYSLWKAFDKDGHLGGACGEITVDLGRGCGNLINPLVAAQNFEYKMSNILDKSLESVFGYISVLPGAFSAYRYRALLNGPDGQGPLQAYFLGEKMHEPGAVATLADSNMYLAEDRILCFEIVAKKKEPWILKYVKSAKASTDVPDSIPEFISQRRRWMNGSFFAAVHSSTHYYRIWTSGQSFGRKIWLSILFLYSFIQLFFSFVGLSSFYLAFYFLCSSATSTSDDPFGGYGDDVISIANSVFISTIGVTVVCALGNKPAGSKWWYVACMTMFAILFCISLYCCAWTIWLAVPHTLAGWKEIKTLLEESAFRDIVISVGATYGLYIASSLLHAEPWHLFTCFIQYMLFLPSYVIVLTIYAFSNLHDLAWGTKGSTSMKDLGHATKKKTEDGKEIVDVDIPTVPDDIDALWLHMRKEIATPHVEVHKKRDVDTKKTDQYANIRTNTLLIYLGVNMLIVVFFTSSIWTNFLAAHSSSDPVTNWYLVGIFWSVAVLSAVRFIGSTLYLLLRLVGF
ncbi:chitin synthase, glycosyltransferase family 2 protein [Pseudohyphozyma bogoriensis]|nr:chitin synthase, glycosyltransferase family 2 protein [Pseudohyphozyma bogoriensis]